MSNKYFIQKCHYYLGKPNIKLTWVGKWLKIRELDMLKFVNRNFQEIWCPQKIALLSIISPPFRNPSPQGSDEKNTPACKY